MYLLYACRECAQPRLIRFKTLSRISQNDTYGHLLWVANDHCRISGARTSFLRLMHVSSVDKTEWNLVSFEFEVGFRTYPDLDYSTSCVLNPEDQARMRLVEILSFDIGYIVWERKPTSDGLLARVDPPLQDILGQFFKNVSLHARQL